MTIPTDIPIPVSPDLASYLRESTRAAHQDAEKRPLNRALARGSISREAWVKHLEQLLLLHRALERRIDRSPRTDACWRTIADPARRRTPDLEADLAFYGGSPAPAAGPATQAALAAIESATDDETIGMAYVIEGSTNGGRFLVRSLCRALSLDPTTGGTRALDPYGDAQPERWSSFKAALQAEPLDPERFDRIRRGADLMFGIVGDVADQFWQEVPASDSI